MSLYSVVKEFWEFASVILGSATGVIAGYSYIERKNKQEKIRKQNFIKKYKEALREYIEALIQLYWNCEKQELKLICKEHLSEQERNQNKEVSYKINLLEKEFEKKINGITENPVFSALIKKFLKKNRESFKDISDIFEVFSLLGVVNTPKIFKEIQINLEVIKENLKTEIYDDEIYANLKSF